MEDSPGLIEGALLEPVLMTGSVTRNVEEPLVSVNVVSSVARELEGPPGAIEGAVIAPALTIVSVTINVEDPTEEVIVLISVIWGTADSPTGTDAVA